MVLLNKKQYFVSPINDLKILEKSLNTIYEVI